MVRVKICGITNWADAKLALDLGAAALGFNFYRRSPRYLTPAAAKRIVGRMPSGVDAVGVFVDELFPQANEIALAVDLDMLQLHGDEPPEVVAEFSDFWPVIKAFRVRRALQPSSLKRYRTAAAFLLDSYSRSMRGGTGIRFDWSMARQAKRYGKIFLAGGLTPDNIAQAIREAQPFAVDVCSGVEAKPGKKDPARLRALMREVETANRSWERGASR